MAEFCTRESDLALLHVNYGQRTEAKELSVLPRGRGAPEGPRLPAPRRGHRIPEADRGERPDRRRDRRPERGPRAGGGPRHLRPVPERAPGRDRRLLGRGDRGEEHLHRRRGRRLLGLPGLPPRILRGDERDDPAGDEGRERHRREGPLRPPVEEGHRPDGKIDGRPLRAVLVVLPGRGEGVRRSAIRAPFGCAPSPRPGSPTPCRTRPGPTTGGNFPPRNPSPRRMFLGEKSGNQGRR